MTTNILGIGLSGLNAAQLGLATTGHNISNANTPGYNRQAIEQATVLPLFTGSGYIGQGTQVVSIQRVYQQYVANQVNEAQTQSSALDTYQTWISQVDNLFGDANTGLTSSLQDFFSNVHNVANDPTDSAARASMLASGQTLAQKFQSLGQQLTQTNSDVNSQITSTVAQINAYASQVAQLNKAIISAQGTASGQPPNDLLDQRDQLVNQLNQLVRTTVVQESNGNYDLFIGSGQALVVGIQNYALSAVNSPDDPGRLTVALTTAGNNVLLPESSLNGGTLGGLLTFRDQTLGPAQNQLGRIALALATSFNNQQQLGQDLNGALGSAFFNVPAPQVIPNTTNAGTAQIASSIVDGDALTASDYALSFDGTNYTLTRLSDNTQQTITPASLAAGVTIDGFSLQLTGGTPQAGDSFLIQPTINGAAQSGVAISNPAQIAAAAPIRTQASAANLGDATISAPTVDPPAPPNANLQQPVTITFTGAATFDVSGAGTGNPTGVAYTSGGAISYNGWSVAISGTPKAGDTFTIMPNIGGSGDNSNALLLAALQNQNAVNSGTQSYQSAYASLVADIGVQASSVQNNQATQAAALSQATQLQQSISGVNLDEEAAKLLNYQQAYQAAAKLIQISDTVFQSLLDLGSS
ncbi:MAG TPA: flagellar hook-associated protein FlgK [Burkholderiales bacterium]|nr:flagellar hook-associated protein FlgK [Burkholderiales bacterium]